MERFQASRTTIYRWVDEGSKNDLPDFPSPVKIHGGNAWIREEIHAYEAEVRRIRDETL